MSTLPSIFSSNSPRVTSIILALCFLTLICQPRLIAEDLTNHQKPCFKILAGLVTLGFAVANAIDDEERTDREFATPVFYQRDPKLALCAPDTACGPVAVASAFLWLAKHRGFKKLLQTEEGKWMGDIEFVRHLEKEFRNTLVFGAQAGGSVGMEWYSFLNQYLSKRGIKFEFLLEGSHNFKTNGPLRREHYKNRSLPVKISTLKEVLQSKDTAVIIRVEWIDKEEIDRTFIHVPTLTIHGGTGSHWLTVVGLEEHSTKETLLKVIDPDPDYEKKQIARRGVPIRKIKSKEGVLVGFDSFNGTTSADKHLRFGSEGIVTELLVIKLSR